MSDDATAGTSVVVVGGGAAGLVVARDLAARGARVHVLEATASLGGCVAAHEVGGLLLDAGAESFSTRSPAVRQLVDELGLGDGVVVPASSGAWVRLADRAVPLPATGVLGIPGDPWATDVLRAVGTLGAARAALDRWLPPRVGLPAGETSLADVVRTRMGRRVLDRLVGPVVAGVYSTSASASDLDTVLPGVRALIHETGSLGAAVTRLRAAAPAGASVASLDGGMHRLVGALRRDLEARGVPISMGTAVEGVARAAGGGWSVRTVGGGRVAADRVVLAVPGPVAVRLLDDVVPEIQVLAGPTADVVLVTLVVDAPALDPAPRGSGVLVAAGVPGMHAKALTHATAKWAWLARAAGTGRHVLRLSYGRSGDAVGGGASSGEALGVRGPRADVRDLPPDRLTELARRDAAALLGVPIPPGAVVDAAVTRWAGVLPLVRPGHHERVEAVRTALAGHDGLTVCGSWLAGTGLAAVVGHARSTAAGVRVGP